MARTLPPMFSDERRLRHKLANLAHSALLLAGMLAILGACAWIVWGETGLAWAVLAGAAALLLTPSVAPDWVMRLYRASPLTPREAPELHYLVDQLAARAGLARSPRLHYLPSRLLNAFAVGTRERAAIALTDGLLRRLSPRELAGVLAHEISHVRNNDLWIMSLADLMSRLAGALSWLGLLLLALSLPVLLLGGEVPWLLALVLLAAPSLMALLQRALSRARELDADLDAATLTRDPQGLASALAKLDRLQGRYWEDVLLPGRRMPEPSLLRTHPPSTARIARLLALAGEDEPPAPAWPDRARRQGLDAAPLPAPRWRWPGVWY
ncbi:MAG: zinc metalloprotease HtpX [Geminicoccaceae bacterium]